MFFSTPATGWAGISPKRTSGTVTVRDGGVRLYGISRCGNRSKEATPGQQGWPWEHGIPELAPMANVLNPEPESITLNSTLETSTLEPATELEQPSFESTSNPEIAEVVEVPALDADAPTEPVAQAETVEAAPAQKPRLQ